MQYTMIVIYHAVVKSHGHKIHESQQRTLGIRIIAVIIIIKHLYTCIKPLFMIKFLTNLVQ